MPRTVLGSEQHAQSLLSWSMQLESLAPDGKGGFLGRQGPKNQAVHKLAPRAGETVTNKQSFELKGAVAHCARRHGGPVPQSPPAWSQFWAVSALGSSS